MKDCYSSFDMLACHEIEGHDYARLLWDRRSRVAIAAPHGGGIEPGTSEIAAAAAGDNFSLYCFEGLAENSGRLHLSSNAFDEPIGCDLIRWADTVVAVHGCRGSSEAIYVGGLNSVLKRTLLEALLKADFPAHEDQTWHAGLDPDNLCNRCSPTGGLQIELSLGMRRTFFAGLSRHEREKQTPLFYHFVTILRQSLASSAILTPG